MQFKYSLKCKNSLENQRFYYKQRNDEARPVRNSHLIKKSRSHGHVGGSDTTEMFQSSAAIIKITSTTLRIRVHQFSMPAPTFDADN